jgi:hypothetical protein
MKRLLTIIVAVLLMAGTVNAEWEYYECLVNSWVTPKGTAAMSGWASPDPSECKATVAISAGEGRDGGSIEAVCVVEKGYQWVGGGTSTSGTFVWWAEIEVYASSSGLADGGYFPCVVCVSSSKAGGQSSGGINAEMTSSGSCSLTSDPFYEGQGSASASGSISNNLYWDYYDAPGDLTWETAIYNATGRGTAKAISVGGIMTVPAGTTRVSVPFIADAKAQAATFDMGLGNPYYSAGGVASCTVAGGVASCTVDGAVGFDDL